MALADPRDVAAEPPPEIRFKFRVDPVRAVKDFWTARPLVRSLAERDFKARYKQAFLGPAWAVLTPLAMLIVFSVFFQRVAKVQTGAVPYPIFSYLGLLPWGLFSSSINRGSSSLISNKPLLNKTYFPREVFPAASVAASAVDFLLSVPALLVLFVIYGYAPFGSSIWLLLLVVTLLAFCMAISLLLSALTVYIRDLTSVLPVILQLGLFATPVGYSIDKVPSAVRLWYCILNPLAPIIDGFRRTVAYGKAPDWGLFLPGLASTVVLLVGSYLLFKRMERGFADVT